MSAKMHYDAIIVGGGPAGLSAALVLGRSRRSVLVIDAGNPRNAASHALHNYLTRDGANPSRFLQLARREVAAYKVEFRSGWVSAATCTDPGFKVRLKVGGTLTARALLLSTGVVDELPTISNVRDFYGKGVHHCPYCDGYEYRGKPLAAYGEGPQGVGLALNLLTWSDDITVVTNGGRLPAASIRQARRYGIKIRTEAIITLRSKRGRPTSSLKDGLGALRFEHGPDLKVAAMFFNTDKMQRSTLPLELGCKVNPQGGIVHDRKQRTGVRGLYLAGDASFDVQFVIVAAAEGAKAGVAMNRDLQEWDRENM